MFRLTHSSERDAKPSFTGFGGFSFKPTQTSTPLPVFGFAKTEAKIPGELKGATGDKNDTQDAKSQNGSSDTPERTTYLSNLKSLNQSVLQWIKQHVDKNPYCILTPIFKDYENHIAELDKEKGNDKDKRSSNGNTQKSLEVAEKPKETESEKAEKHEQAEMPKSGLTFGMGTLSAANSTGGLNPAPFSGFNFGTTKTSMETSGFSFAVGATSARKLDTVTEAGDEDEYVPPKPHVIQVEEEGSLYTKKCKLFYQKNDAWQDRGVGNLHLKKLDDKPQLLIRADTSLGNILLNIMLSSSIPAARQGKNNVSLVCIPNPPIDPKAKENVPVPMLVRVKTGDDADELFKQINELKG